MEPDQDNCDAMSAPGPGPPMSVGHYHRNYPRCPGSGQVNTGNNETCLSDAHGFHLNMIIIVLTILLTLQASIFSMNVHAGAISPWPTACMCIHFHFISWKRRWWSCWELNVQRGWSQPRLVILVTDLMRNGNFATNRGFYLRNILHIIITNEHWTPFSSSRPAVSQDQWK